LPHSADKDIFVGFGFGIVLLTCTALYLIPQTTTIATSASRASTSTPSGFIVRRLAGLLPRHPIDTGQERAE